MYPISVIITSPEFFLRHQNQPVSQICRCPKVYSVLAKIKMTLRRKLRWADGKTIFSTGTKRTNHQKPPDGLYNRPAQPVLTISLNERNAVINNRESIVRSTINKPHHTKIMINEIFERDDFSVSDTGCSEEKIRVLSIEDEPMTVWLLVRMLFPSKLQETGEN